MIKNKLNIQGWRGTVCEVHKLESSDIEEGIGKTIRWGWVRVLCHLLINHKPVDHLLPVLPSQSES